MESTESPTGPGDAGSQLAAAEALRTQLTRTLRLPSWFHESIGAAVAFQVGTIAYAVSRPSVGAAVITVLVAGVVVFAAVAAVQLARFRRLNGVWVGGLASRAVLGSSTLSSIVYAVFLSAAVGAGMAGLWWLSVLAAAGGGAGYALSGRHWWAAYQREPAKNAHGEPLLIAAGAFVVALTGFVVVASGRW